MNHKQLDLHRANTYSHAILTCSRLVHLSSTIVKVHYDDGNTIIKELLEDPLLLRTVM